MGEISVFVVIGIAVMCTTLSTRKEIEKPLSDKEIAKDLPFAKEAEEAQWKFYEQSRKLKAQ